MIHQCDSKKFEIIYYIINDAAQNYEGVIREDGWKEHYLGLIRVSFN